MNVVVMKRAAAAALVGAMILTAGCSMVAGLGDDLRGLSTGIAKRLAEHDSTAPATE